jgi:hypothetical protein
MAAVDDIIDVEIKEEERSCRSSHPHACSVSSTCNKARQNLENPPTTTHKRSDLRAISHLKKERMTNGETDPIDLRRKR